MDSAAVKIRSFHEDLVKGQDDIRSDQKMIIIEQREQPETVGGKIGFSTKMASQTTTLDYKRNFEGNLPIMQTGDIHICNEDFSYQKSVCFGSS